MTSKKSFKKQGGRPPKTDPAKIRYSISFTEEEHARFLILFEKSGMLVKAHFITSQVFGKEMKSVKIDKGTVDCYMRLNKLNSQCR